MRPDESVFGVPEPQRWGGPPHGTISDVIDRRIPNIADNREAVPVAQDAQPAGEVQWVNTELHAIASTIETLQSRLEEANSRLSSVEKVETTEVEIGRLFVEAQRFSEAWLSKLELKIYEVLEEAEAKAKQILVEATEDAQEIRRRAQQAAFSSSQTVHELQSAIVGFTTVNSELLKELGTLNGMLTPDNDRGGAQLDPPVEAELRSTEQDSSTLPD